LKKKYLISINGKKKFKRILVEGEKVKLRKLPSKDFILVFFTEESLFCSEALPVKSSFKLKCLRCMILSNKVKEIAFRNGN